MAIYAEHRQGGLHWAVWNMSESMAELFALLPLDSRDVFKQELQAFSSMKRQREWLTVRVLLYTMLQEEKQIQYAPDGKPYLLDRSHYISISHTQGYVAVALSAAHPIGIDIERYSERIRRVADRFLHPNERQDILYQSDDTWSLLLYWSAKETVFKCMENPDSNLQQLCVIPFRLQSSGTLTVKHVGEQQSFAVEYRIYPDFVLTWTARL